MAKKRKPQFKTQPLSKMSGMKGKKSRTYKQTHLQEKPKKKGA